MRKEGWEYKKLGDISIDWYRGSGIKRDQITQSGMPCIRYGEIYTTYNIGFHNCVSHTNESLIISPKYIEKGDILFAITGESVEDIGKCVAYLGTEKCLVGGDVAVMKHNQNPKYLGYALSSPWAIKQKGLGKTKLKVVHTNIPSLKEIAVPVPPLKEQEEIVAYLDGEFERIEKLKRNAEAALQHTKDLFQSTLKQLLTPKPNWEEKKLGRITTKIGSGATPKGGKKIYIEKGCSLIRSMNVLYGEFKYDELAHIDDNAAGQLKGVAIEENDVLLNITGASIARCCVVPKDVIPARVNQHVSIIRLTNVVLPHFLAYQLINPYNQKTLLTIGESGSTRQALTKTDIENFTVSIPPLAEQQAIVSRLDTLSEHCRKLEQNYRDTLTLCDDLKQALLREVFE